MASADGLEQRFSQLSLAGKDPRLLKRIPNVHKDDIHGLQLLPKDIFKDKQSRFLSGSKDGTVKLWSVDGDRELELLTSDKIDYKEWVTSLSCYGKRFQAGTREGVLYSWLKHPSSDSDVVFEMVGSSKIPPLKIDGRRAIAKEKNTDRINCIFPLSKLSPENEGLRDLIILGQPLGITIFDTAASKVVGSQILHQNDWAYCVVPLSNSDSPLVLAIVIGSSLATYSFNIQDAEPLSNKYEVWSSRYSASARTTVSKRPHIASLVKVCDSSLLVGGCFDGTVRCFNPEKRRCISELTGHRNRVWDVLSLSSSTVISGADDRTVRLWDIRCPPGKESLKWTSPFLIGRASSLLQVSECVVVCGSCHEKPDTNPDKGCLYFFDIRVGY